MVWKAVQRGYYPKSYTLETAIHMQEALYQQEKRAYIPEKLLQSKEIATRVVNALSLPRTAEVTDIHVPPLIKP